MDSAVTLETIRGEDPTARCPPPPAILALVGTSSHPEMLARAARVLRKLAGAPDRRASAALGRALLGGLKLRPPAEWWALGECAETIGALGKDDPAAARCLHDALEKVLGARADADSEAEQLAETVLAALAALGTAAARSLPTIEALVEDVVLGPAASAAIAAIAPSEEFEPRTDRHRRVRSLLPEDRCELDAARHAARVRTGLPAGAPPIEIVSAVVAEIRLIDPGLAEDDCADLAFQLGVLWGDQVVRAAGWEWVELSWDAGSAPAIVSPDRAYACFPTRLIADAIEVSRGALAAKVFRQIQTRTLPAAGPNELAVIG